MGSLPLAATESSQQRHVLERGPFAINLTDDCMIGGLAWSTLYLFLFESYYPVANTIVRQHSSSPAMASYVIRHQMVFDIKW
jgi:hypothetical protein